MRLRVGQVTSCAICLRYDYGCLNWDFGVGAGVSELQFLGLRGGGVVWTVTCLNCDFWD